MKDPGWKGGSKGLQKTTLGQHLSVLGESLCLSLIQHQL